MVRLLFKDGKCISAIVYKTDIYPYEPEEGIDMIETTEAYLISISAVNWRHYLTKLILVEGEVRLAKGTIIDEKDNEIEEPTTEENEPEPSEADPLKQEIADLAFQKMLLEHEIKQQKQAIADLEFNLMMGGVI